MILNETMVDIADAIREKKGKSELIKPVDFAEEIKGITSGGGSGESGGGEWIYLDYKKIPKDELWGGFALGMCYTAKLNTGGSIQIRPLNYFWLLGSNINEIAETVVAIAIDRGTLIGSVEEGLYPLGTMFSSVTNLDDYCITKEQFYSLE